MMMVMAKGDDGNGDDDCDVDGGGDDNDSCDDGDDNLSL